MSKSNFSLDNLVRESKKHAFVPEKRRIIIIPNNSDDHLKLVQEYKKEKIGYSVDYSKNPPAVEDVHEIYKDCYVVDFRIINLV